MARVAARLALAGVGTATGRGARAQTISAAARVVAVGGGITEIVYALGAQARLVATDTTSTWPEAAARTPKVGYLRALSAEGVLALRPQLLLASHEAGPPAVIERIAAVGVRVVRLPERYDFDGLTERVDTVAAALGHAADGAALVARLASAWQRARADVAALTGAALALAADAVSRTVVVPAELPIGVPIALLGTPLFVALLLRARDAGRL